MTQGLRMESPFDSMPPTYMGAMEYIVNIVSDRLHDQLHTNRPHNTHDFARMLQNSMADAFEAGVIWRDFHIDTPLEQPSCGHQH